jgi:hypothetical protein
MESKSSRETVTSPTSWFRLDRIQRSSSVEGVTFENVTRYGKRLTSDSSQMSIGQYTKDVIVK